MVVSEQELLNPKEQDAVLQDIALVLAHNLPAGWQECVVVYGAVGEHAETTVRIERLNGPPADVTGPEVLGELFGRLRTGMYRPGVGTWFGARFQLTHPVDYRVEYDNTRQPEWSTPPPAEAYADELRAFPRAAEHVPDWLRRSMADAAGAGDTGDTGDADVAADAPAAAVPPRFQMARLFDSLGPGETPQVNRPPVPDAEADAVADYLTKAPMVLAARSLDNDLLHPARPAKVPLSYLTDGTWIWPGGVGYYLRTHGVPPESELVEHIRRQGFQPPEVDEYTREVAVAAIMGQSPPAPPATATATPVTAPAADEAVPQERVEPASPAPESAAPPPPAAPVAERTEAGPVPPAEPAPAGPTPDVPAREDAEPVGSAPAEPAQGEPGPAGPTPIGAALDESALAAPVPEEAAPVESAPVESVPVESVPVEPPQSEPAPIGSVQAAPGPMEPAPPSGSGAGEQASAEEAAPFEPAAGEQAPAEPPPAAPGLADGDVRALDRLRARLAELDVDPESYGVEMIVDRAWCLVREDVGWTVFRSAGGDRAVSVAFPAAEQAAAFLLGSLLMSAAAGPPRPAAPSPAAAPPPPVTQPDISRPARTYDGPIEPLPGEPPVTLFRNLRELELVAGTEIDRVGDPAGNLTYAAGTHYSQRSLPQEWADRPYHVYRLSQPLRVLIGTAVPWFEQPGGGTGYFLPAAIAELVADGTLDEIEPAQK